MASLRKSVLRRSCWRWLVTLVMLCCLLVQVWDGLFKFVRQQTTVVSKRRQLTTARMPALSFCPGYKDHSKDYYDRSDELSRILDDFEDTRTPLEIWMNDTYDIDEVIKYVKAPGVDWYNIPEIYVNRTGFHEGANLTVVEISSAYGRCYAIHFDYVLSKSAQYFSLRLNLSQHDELFLYFHENHNEVGQNWGFYPIKAIQAIVKKGAHYTIVVQKNTFKPWNNVGCEQREDYSYPLCVVRWARKRFLDIFAENNRTACWIPDVQYYAIDSNVSPCQTQEEANWVRATVYSQITEHLEDRETTGCPRRCVQARFGLNFLREPNLDDSSTDQKDLTYVYLQNSFESNEDEEVVLYDLNNIIAALGGSMSLFLGVSVFSIIIYGGDKARDFIASRKFSSRSLGKRSRAARKRSSIKQLIKWPKNFELGGSLPSIGTKASSGNQVQRLGPEMTPPEV